MIKSTTFCVKKSSNFSLSTTTYDWLRRVLMQQKLSLKIVEQLHSMNTLQEITT